MKAKRWCLIPLVFFMILSLFLARGLFLDPRKLPSNHIGKSLPAFDLPELYDQAKRFTPSLMRGKISLLNIFASWCTACADEQLFLLNLAEKGLPIYGINYKDRQEDALAWLKEWGNPYQAIASDSQGRLAIDLGVYGTPETFLIDALGVIRFRYAGVLDETVWRKEFLWRITELKSVA